MWFQTLLFSFNLGSKNIPPESTRFKFLTGLMRPIGNSTHQNSISPNRKLVEPSCKSMIKCNKSRIERSKNRKPAIGTWKLISMQDFSHFNIFDQRSEYIVRPKIRSIPQVVKNNEEFHYTLSMLCIILVLRNAKAKHIYLFSYKLSD